MAWAIRMKVDPAACSSARVASVRTEPYNHVKTSVSMPATISGVSIYTPKHYTSRGHYLIICGSSVYFNTKSRKACCAVVKGPTEAVPPEYQKRAKANNWYTQASLEQFIGTQTIALGELFVFLSPIGQRQIVSTVGDSSRYRFV